MAAVHHSLPTQVLRGAFLLVLQGVLLARSASWSLPAEAGRQATARVSVSVVGSHTDNDGDRLQQRRAAAVAELQSIFPLAAPSLGGQDTGGRRGGDAPVPPVLVLACVRGGAECVRAVEHFRLAADAWVVPRRGGRHADRVAGSGGSAKSWRGPHGQLQQRPSAVRGAAPHSATTAPAAYFLNCSAHESICTSLQLAAPHSDQHRPSASATAGPARAAAAAAMVTLYDVAGQRARTYSGPLTASAIERWVLQALRPPTVVVTNRSAVSVMLPGASAYAWAVVGGSDDGGTGGSDNAGDDAAGCGLLTVGELEVAASTAGLVAFVQAEPPGRSVALPTACLDSLGFIDAGGAFTEFVLERPTATARSSAVAVQAAMHFFRRMLLRQGTTRPLLARMQRRALERLLREPLHEWSKLEREELERDNGAAPLWRRGRVLLGSSGMPGNGRGGGVGVETEGSGVWHYCTTTTLTNAGAGAVPTAFRNDDSAAFVVPAAAARECYHLETSTDCRQGQQQRRTLLWLLDDAEQLDADPGRELQAMAKAAQWASAGIGSEPLAESTGAHGDDVGGMSVVVVDTVAVFRSGSGSAHASPLLTRSHFAAVLGDSAPTAWVQGRSGSGSGGSGSGGDDGGSRGGRDPVVHCAMQCAPGDATGWVLAGGCPAALSSTRASGSAATVPLKLLVRACGATPGAGTAAAAAPTTRGRRENGGQRDSKGASSGGMGGTAINNAASNAAAVGGSSFLSGQPGVEVATVSAAGVVPSSPWHPFPAALRLAPGVSVFEGGDAALALAHRVPRSAAWVLFMLEQRQSPRRGRGRARTTQARETLSATWGGRAAAAPPPQASALRDAALRAVAAVPGLAEAVSGGCVHAVCVPRTAATLALYEHLNALTAPAAHGGGGSGSTAACNTSTTTAVTTTADSGEFVLRLLAVDGDGTVEAEDSLAAAANRVRRACAGGS